MLEWVERKELGVICMKAVIRGSKARDESTERGSVHNEK